MKWFYILHPWLITPVFTYFFGWNKSYNYNFIDIFFCTNYLSALFKVYCLLLMFIARRERSGQIWSRSKKYKFPLLVYFCFTSAVGYLLFINEELIFDKKTIDSIEFTSSIPTFLSFYLTHWIAWRSTVAKY